MPTSTAKQRPGKWVVIYSLLVILLFSAIALLQKLGEDTIASYYYLAQASALALGIFHILVFYKVTDLIMPGDFWKGLLFTVLLALFSAIGIIILYHFVNGDDSFTSFVIPFIVPYLCWQVYRAFIGIPPRIFKLWHYPVHEQMPDLDMIDLSQIEVVQFIFNKNSQETAQTNFTSKAPLNMPLGMLFFIFINDYNEKNRQQPIGFLDAAQAPFGWLFFRRKKWFGARHYFDPDLSFRENRILPNERIYAIRK